MAKKENKGGILTNEEIERDLKAKGVEEQKGGYRGTQDTGADVPKNSGTDVQKKGGVSEDKVDEEA